MNESGELKKMNQMKEEMTKISKQMTETEKTKEERLRRVEEMHAMKHQSKLLEAEEAHLMARSLGDDVRKNKVLRENQAFQNAFRQALCQRMTAAFLHSISQLTKEEPVLKLEIPKLDSSLKKVHHDLNTVSDVQRKSEVIRNRLEDEMRALQNKIDRLNTEKAKTLADGERYRKGISRKQDQKLVLRQVTRLLCAFTQHTTSTAFCAAEGKDTKELEELHNTTETQQKRKVTEHNNYISALTKEISSLGDQVKKIKDEVESFRFDSSTKIRKVHADCIFLDNENKRLLDELDDSTATITKNFTANFFATKEELQGRTNKAEMQLRIFTSNSHSVTIMPATIELEKEKQVEMRALEVHYSSVIDEEETQIQKRAREGSNGNRRDCERVDALNTEIEQLLREAAVQHTCEKIFAQLMDSGVDAALRVLEIDGAGRRIIWSRSMSPAVTPRRTVSVSCNSDVVLLSPEASNVKSSALPADVAGSINSSSVKQKSTLKSLRPTSRQPVTTRAASLRVLALDNKRKKEQIDLLEEQHRKKVNDRLASQGRERSVQEVAPQAVSDNNTSPQHRKVMVGATGMFFLSRSISPSSPSHSSPLYSSAVKSLKASSIC